MNIFNEFIKSELFLIIIAGINILLLILYINNVIKLKKINKNYKNFIKKLGSGNDIDEMLKKYIDKVDKVEIQNKEIIEYCNRLDKNISTCIKKIGLVRYSAFKDTGSDLSFALALLNDNNDGVVLNGIYSREMSNIYAKQIKMGKANNKLSEEERQALEKAIN
ncbi:MAG: DUF4446 family protein [Clostridia bacterium]|nr:DUF4446 family protein [Clostridia bacterium]